VVFRIEVIQSAWEFVSHASGHFTCIILYSL